MGLPWTAILLHHLLPRCHVLIRLWLRPHLPQNANWRGIEKIPEVRRSERVLNQNLTATRFLLPYEIVDLQCNRMWTFSTTTVLFHYQKTLFESCLHSLVAWDNARTVKLWSAVWLRPKLGAFGPTKTWQCKTYFYPSHFLYKPTRIMYITHHSYEKGQNTYSVE